jgi:hypothetical protein
MPHRGSAASMRPEPSTVTVQAIYADGYTWEARTETPVRNLQCALASLEHHCLVYRACDANGKPIREWVRGPRGFIEVRHG